MNTTGGAAGPWVVGLLVDITGHYRAGWLTAALVALAAAPPRALMARYRAEAEAAAPGRAGCAQRVCSAGNHVRGARGAHGARGKP